MSEQTGVPSDEHLPTRSGWRQMGAKPGVLAGASLAAVLLVGGVAFAMTNGDDADSSAATTSRATSTDPSATTHGPSSSPEATNATTSTIARTTSSPATTAGGPPALTTIPGQTIPTAPPDTSPDTTLPAPPSTTPPTPSTTGPDTRTPTQAYAQEYEKYCRNAFAISPDGVLIDPDFIDDTYTVDDCLYWLDPEWGEFFDTPAEAAQEGIYDAISTIEDMTSISGALCWLDPATEQWGGCWYSPN